MSQKKILLLVTQDHGGAGEGILKIARLLDREGHKVALLVKNKTKIDNFIFEYNHKKTPITGLYNFLSNKITKKIIKYKNKYSKIELNEDYYFFSSDEKSININTSALYDLIGFTPEFVFSGWTAGFLNSSDLLLIQKSSNAVIHNISVDMNHFTGGCHYAWDCRGFTDGCDTNCPAILTKTHKKLAEKNFNLKFKNAKSGNFKIICGSGWTLKQAQNSKIYKNQNYFPNINSLIDTNVMKLDDKNVAKKHFGLEKDKFYILMGCQNGNEKRKGFEYLLKSLNIFYKELSREEIEKIIVLIVSKNQVNSFNEIPFNKKHLDFVDDYSKLSLLYQAVNVFVNSSIEDSGPMMVSESLSCGTPVVGFDMGVVNNMVINGYNGYKAELFNSNDLAIGIKTIFDLTSSEYKSYSINSINQIKEFSSFEYGMQVFNKILNE